MLVLCLFMGVLRRCLFVGVYCLLGVDLVVAVVLLLFCCWFVVCLVFTLVTGVRVGLLFGGCITRLL